VAELAEYLPALLGHTALPPQETGNLIAQITGLARKMRKTGWGNDGDPVGLKEMVSVKQLWYFPELSLKYSDDEIDAMGNSLIEMKDGGDFPTGQISSLIVMRCNDPRPVAAGGNSTGRYLIVDGCKRFTAMTRKNIHKAIVDIREYYGFYDYFTQRVITKVSPHDMTGMEIGSLGNRLRQAHALDVAKGGEGLEEFPTLEILAKKLGRSPAQLSRCMRLDALYTTNATFRQLLDSGQVNQAQALELVSLPDDQVMLELQRIVGLREQGLPAPTRDDLRERKQVLRLVSDKTPTMYFPDYLRSTVGARELRAPRFNMADQPLPILFSVYARDLRVIATRIIDAIEESHDKVDPALKAIFKALSSDRLEGFIQETSGIFVEEDEPETLPEPVL